jgi:hypothetical protein
MCTSLEFADPLTPKIWKRGKGTSRRSKTEVLSRLSKIWRDWYQGSVVNLGRKEINREGRGTQPDSMGAERPRAEAKNTNKRKPHKTNPHETGSRHTHT